MFSYWIIFSYFIATNFLPCHLGDSCIASCKDPNASPNKCGSACQPTCAMPDPGVCTLQCVVDACECNKGYILDKTNGTCILQEDCPCCKDPNATPNECGSACQPTCEKPNPGICTLQCVINACECNQGYILDKTNGTCVPYSDCPYCGCNGDPNAHATECVSCTPACEDNEPIGCAAVCLKGCDCNKGYTYSQKLEKCILTSSPDCVPCPKNQEWSGCINAICRPLTCDDVGYQTVCAQYLRGGCTSKGCVCKTNYVKDSNNECIPVNQCPSCGGDCNATGGCDKTCKNGKGNTCCNYKDDVSCDQSYCDLFGCECKDGYVYQNSTGNCVSPCDC